MLQQDEHYNMMFSLNQNPIVPGLCTFRATSHVIAWNVMAEHVTWKNLVEVCIVCAVLLRLSESAERT